MAAHLQSLGFAPGARIATADEELRALLHRRAGDLDGRRHHGGDLPDRDRRQPPLRARAQRGAACCSSASSTTGRSRRRACRPACRASRCRSRRRRASESRRWDDIVARTAPLAGRPQRARRRPGDDLLHVGLHRPAQGRDAQLRPHHARHRVHARRPRAPLPEGVPRRTISYLPLAHVFERAVVECRCLQVGRRPRSSSASRSRPSSTTSSARGPRSSSRCRACGSSSSRACCRRCRPSKLDALLADPATAPAVGRKVLASLGLDEVRRAGSGVGADPALAAGLVPPPGPAPGRGLRHDRGLRLLAPHDRTTSSPAATSASPAPACRCASPTTARC